jgi:hypothetical protein
MRVGLVPHSSCRHRCWSLFVQPRMAGKGRARHHARWCAQGFSPTRTGWPRRTSFHAAIEVLRHPMGFSASWEGPLGFEAKGLKTTGRTPAGPFHGTPDGQRAGRGNPFPCLSTPSGSNPRSSRTTPSLGRHCHGVQRVGSVQPAFEVGSVSPLAD